MHSKQLRIPGLEEIEKPASTDAGRKRQTFEQQLKDLQDRVLQLELEITLLRIQLENKS